jgi:hypothetical protein
LKSGVAPTRQAVSKARTGLDPEFIHQLVNDHAAVACACDDIELFAGKYRICAIDGSGVSVSNSLKNVFGTDKGSATALVSLVFDPLNNVILDGTLHPRATDERVAARENIAAAEKISAEAKNLYIFDRGYNARRFVAWMIDRKYHFLMRVRSKYDLTFDNADGRGEYHLFDCAGRSYAVRVLKIKLDGGEAETLITNLKRGDFPWNQAKNLYFERWGIENKFKELKEKLALESMRGKREITVRQDFFATLWLSNFAATVRWNTDAIIVERTSGKRLKHRRKTDVNRLLGNLRDTFYRSFAAPVEAERAALLEALFRDVARFDVEVKLGRHVPRNRKLRATPCEARNCVGVR